MKRFVLAIALLTPSVSSWGLSGFPDIGYIPPADWTDPMFVLSQAYPNKLPEVETLPWDSIEPAKDPEKYLQAVLGYCFEGNEEHGFDVLKNTVRPWFHAPWMHVGNNRREFVHGLTRERGSRPYEIAATQTAPHRNYAVGMYNARGGYTFGQVWLDPNKPNVDAALFPEGTVTFKLLFTTAPVSQVPLLEGAPVWVADIDNSPTAAAVQQNVVRLLQIDVAVKDRRSHKGGWIFGTYHYDKDVEATSPWRRVRPLSLMWGDDPQLSAEAYAAGTRAAESWINNASPIVAYRANPPSGIATPRTLGLHGRANGPVDNALSSCLSCHGTAQLPASAAMVPPANLSDAQRMQWFRNLAVAEAFSSGSKSLDYSLQLGVGLQNHAEYNDLAANKGGLSTRLLKAKFLGTSPEVRFTRDVD